jgi:peptidoglycan-associated lipoprotein
LAALLLVGCDAPGFTRKAQAPQPPLQQQPIGTVTTTGANLQGLAGGVTQMPAVFTPGLSVSDAIAKACGITPTNGKTSTMPSFEYDSTSLGDADRGMLAEVAKCLTEGALKGRAITLIGRADARGEPEYNMTLGESRANGVHRYMVDLGVAKDRMKPTSRGEMDATGTNEEGWARDRRVDIELVM